MKKKVLTQSEWNESKRVVNQGLNNSPAPGEDGHIDDHAAIAGIVNYWPNIPYMRITKKAENSWEAAGAGFVENYDDSTADMVLDEANLGSMMFAVLPDGHTDAASSSVGAVINIYTAPGMVYGYIENIANLYNFRERAEPQISNLETKVDALETENSTLNATVSTLESDSATLNTTVSQLGEDVTALSTANSTLEGKISTLESDNVSLNTTVSGLETDLGSLSSANDTLNSTVSTLEGNVTTLTSDKEALEGQVSTLQSTIADLTARLDALETPGGEV